MRIVASRPWPDLVFHVLAHVPVDVPAGAYDARYVAFAERHLGPARERSLGEDARILAATLASHERLARAQLVAWLFPTVEVARRDAAVDLADLDASTCDARVRDALLPLAPAVELLRCAVELEADAHARLPPVTAAPLEGALAAVVPAAPALARFDVMPVRSLRLRGRVHGREIWIGQPCPELELEPSHVAWQAAHEATVAEVLPRHAHERDAERAALALLAERACEVGLAEAHARWLAHYPDVI